MFDLDVPLAQFSGRTVEESGKVPVVGADVDIWPVQPQSTPRQLRDRSNHFGEFSFTGLEPGEYLLSAYKPGYEMHRERISYGSAIEGMMIRLRPGEGVQIRVRDARSGRPIQSVRANETLGERHGSSLQVRLDENGLGRIPSALAGSTLTFYAGDYVPAVVRDWSGQELDLQLEKQAAP